MNPELVAAFAGAGVGALLTGVLGYLQIRWSRNSQLRVERDSQRLALVREIMRYRLNQERLIGPLNELPLVFGDNDEVLRLYRETLNSTDTASKNRAITDMLNRLAKLVNLPPKVQESDIQRGFLIAD